MSFISKRSQEIPESPIRKLSPYAQKARDSGTKIYHLNIGQPDIKTPKIAIDAVKNLDTDLIPYTQSEGIYPLQKALLDYYAKHQIDLSTKDILVTTGASEAIFFLMNTIADSGDEIIIPEPFYANYLGFAMASEIKIKPILSHFDNNFALPSVEAFEQHITPRTRAILICNPGNPTGYLCSKEEILQLVAIAKKHSLYLIADEVYREFIYDTREHYSVMQVDDFEHQAVMVDSLSKRYSMCGARVGCIVTRNRSLIAHITKLSQARLCPPFYGQIAAQAALNIEDDYYKKIVEEYRSRRDVLIEELLKIPGVKVSSPAGAFYCMVSLPVDDADHFSKWLLDSFEYKKQTVMLAPASGFYITPHVGSKLVRLAYVLNKKDLRLAVQLLKRALEVYTIKQ